MLPFLMSEMMRGSPGFLLAVKGQKNNNKKMQIKELKDKEIIVKQLRAKQ